ncbi:hypothetical protein QYE76_048442 [Lolium multiflorum]|uniref:Transposase (putative) gypsy type domain-containing protein n=1 Tax=Lolium multiflorum TaxID=4521 RepID=A0AAD8SL15_LOLMU|nr:hypothetical protein QYE76_048442 [Lolium multiflorum]
MATEDLEWERSKISNQDMNLLKKLGFTKKENALRFPKEESYPSPPIEYRVSFVDHLIRGLSPLIHEFLRGLLFVDGLQLHQLTPNSILHISIFITLCECFLGVHPNWALWKRIFCVRRNGSHNVTYNIDGVVICVRSDVEYFDVKFPDSVQGWRKRWLYVHEESPDSVEYKIAPFDGGAKILRRRSWDVEATEEEKLATEALMTRIHELHNTRGKELSGIQITAYFLRIRVQPLQARKNPLWMYAGEEDVDKDLPVKDLEKLIRRISSLSKKDTIPFSCRVEPYSGINALPEGTSRPESEVAGSHKSAASSEKEVESEATTSTHSLPSAISPSNKRKRDKVADSGTSKAGASHAEEVVPTEGRTTFNPYEDALVSSGDEDEDLPIDATARTKNLAEANKRVDSLALKLEQSKKARKKAEANAAAVEDLRKRLRDAEASLSENITQQSSREEDIIARLESHSRRFVRRTQQDYDLENPEGDRLLDALSLLEIHGDEARQGLTDARIVLSRLFPFYFVKKEEPETFTALAKCFRSKENLGPSLRQEGLKIGVEGTIALVADSQQNVHWAKVGDVKEMETNKWQSLIRAAKPNSKKILAFLGFNPTPAPSSSKPEVK